jgi:uncharacterized protein (TIGR03084 family)
MKELCRDLAEEHEALDVIVVDLTENEWDTATPAEPWTIRDEITHLAYFDGAARLAASDAAGFAKHVEELIADMANFEENHLKKGRILGAPGLMAWWRRERADLLSALEPLDPKQRLPWYGPPMSARSFATARLMETWAHGQDVVDALSVRRTPTDRLRHVAHIGVTTFAWSFMNRQMEVPQAAVRVELTSPSGALWTWGPEDARDRVRGAAEDFCLVVTQRRHVLDTDLTVDGEVARRWMELAQAFAGPPGRGREPGRFKGRNQR